MNSWDVSESESGTAGWLDRLVELHVLAAHGDPGAVAAAKDWLAADVEARRVWEQVQRTCDDLGAAPDEAGATEMRR